MQVERDRVIFTSIFALGLLVKYNVLMLFVVGVPLPATQLLRSAAILALVYVYLLPASGRRGVRVGAYCGAVLFTVVFLANLWYNRYFGNYLSLSELTGGESFNAVEVLVRHIIRPSDLLYLIDLLVMGLSIKTFGAGLNTRQEPPSPFIIPRIRSSLLLLTVVGLLSVQAVVAHYRVGAQRAPELFVDSTPAFASVYGLVPLYAFELYLRLAGTPGVRAELPSEHTGAIDPEPLVDSYSNIIVIQVESLDKKLINYSYNGQEVVPFVNSLVESSLYGHNFYAQHVNGSFDADFSVLTGLYPVNRQYSFRDNDMSRFPSLVRILNERGYQTLAFHGNDAEFFHRGVAYSELGFDRFYSRPDFSMDDRIYRVEDSYLGINDYDFFRQSLQVLEGKLEDKQEPFFAYFITVTSHTPFSFYPEAFAVDAFDELHSEFVRDFFNSVYFVDYALQMFFQSLKELGLKDNTLIIMFSDHEAALETPEYSSSIGFEVSRNIKEPEHIPLIIRHPDIEPNSLEKTGSLTDLAPTILDILGFDDIDPEFMGSSLLQPTEQPVLFIHELPQILYRDQLFVAELGELTKIGHIEGRDANIDIPPEKGRTALEKIRFSREVMLERRRVE
ncbi:MAG: LTA synthase family protein [Spirochaetaceae bacterium]|nr:MAG: LTA synthase family protein [Spirochaetaceae bacterium]